MDKIMTITVTILIITIIMVIKQINVEVEFWELNENWDLELRFSVGY